MSQLSTVETQATTFSPVSPVVRRVDTAGMWRERAIETYNSTRLYRTSTLQGELSRRLKSLTGHGPAPDTILVDAENRTASVLVDGTLFRLEGGELTLERACTYCGAGDFRSLPINDLADLGHALVVWQPLHAECQAEDGENWLDM